MSKKNIETTGVSIVSETTDKAPKFTVEALKPYAFELFGVSKATYAGATYNLHGEYTVEEMKSHINNWFKKEVK